MLEQVDQSNKKIKKAKELLNKANQKLESKISNVDIVEERNSLNPIIISGSSSGLIKTPSHE